MPNAENVETQDSFDITDKSQENVDNIWYQAENLAMEYAQNKSLTLWVTASWLIAKSLIIGRRKINPIEWQKITIYNKELGKKVELWNILPAVSNLGDLKTPETIYKEIKDLIDSYLEAEKNWELDEYSEESSKIKNEIQKLWAEIIGELKVFDNANWKLKINDGWYLSIEGFDVRLKGSDVNIDAESTESLIINKNGTYIDLIMNNTDWTTNYYNIDTDMFSEKKWYYKLSKWKSEDE